MSARILSFPVTFYDSPVRSQTREVEITDRFSGGLAADPLLRMLLAERSAEAATFLVLS